MSPRNHFSRWLSAPVVLGASLAIAADGEIQQVCNCNRGGGMSMPMSMGPVPDYMPPQMPAYSPLDPMLLTPPASAAAGTDPAGVSPPPGTLGRTYSLPTKLLPPEKHPRQAMLDIRSTAEEVVVSDTKEFREEGDIKSFQDEDDPTLWHFETKPLLSGVPHIYKVEMINGGVTTDVRYVRLIRGRILELSF
jgi:hypothetical protein